MVPRTVVYAFVSLALGGPGIAAAMGFGTTPPTVSAPTVSSPVLANAAATVGCAATGTTTVSALKVTVSAGALDNGTTTEALAIAAGTSVSGTATWTAPAPGNVIVTCTATDTLGDTASASTTVTVQAAAVAPVAIDSMSGPSGPVLVGGTAPFSVTAHDPLGGTLSYAWTATGGTLQAAGASATWSAPEAAGPASITVTVTSTSASAPASQTYPVTVILTGALGALGDPLAGPHRLAVSPEGRIYVVDGQGGFHELTARGESMGPVYLPAPALAVAAGPGVAWVSTVDGKVLKVDPSSGKVVGTIDVGYAQGPTGLAYDASAGLLWMAERGAAQVRALRPDGTTAVTILAANGQALTGVSDVALDAANGLVWASLDYDPGAPMAFAFHAKDGTFASAAFAGGTGPGQVFRAGGIGVDASGRVYVTDAYQGVVQVASGAGLFLGTLGSFGTEPGKLREPAGVAALASGNVVVANSDDARLEQYGNAPAVPECAGDSDCDGMPDWWELAHGLNPYWAGDALLDYDHDGLTNLQEYQHGTDPWNPDTDGDGVSDGDEVAAGTDPLVDDRKPVLSATDPKESGPGLVRWSSTLVRGRGTCAVAWTQTGGPDVTIRGAATFTPSFVGRVADAYRFQGVATCGKGVSDPVAVTARIVDVAPRPDAGRMVVVHAGKPFALDGSFSSDGNGDAFGLAWDEVLGPALRSSGTGSELLVQAGRPGYSAFQLTAAEPGGLSATAQAPVYVVDSGEDAPSALAASPVVAQAGTAVALDARASVAGEDGRFAWRQVDGPVVTLSGAATATPSFVPPQAGRYAFEVTVSTEEVASPPARVEVYAAAAGASLPVAAVQPVAGPAAIGEPLTLDGASSTGTGRSYAWRQVSGPAAGLTDADQGVATVVPFAAGSYVFELTVSAGGAVGVPARVRFEASGPDAAVPKAVAVARQGKGGWWTLDGTGSGPGALRYRWTQVGGPWVALDDATAAAPRFEAKRAGTYAFELEVDDGAVRSAPARVTVVVTERED